jgi:hypothetical protein
MRYKHKLEQGKRKVTGWALATLFLLMFSLSPVLAQESVNATGGNASGNGGSASYSVGQVAYHTQTGTNGLLGEGVQQPYEILVATGLEEAQGINLLVSAYPNPTTGHLTLRMDENVKTSRNGAFMTYQLYDMQGKLLQSEKITDNPTRIVMSGYIPATYFLKVKQGNRAVKTFQIIKK